jgi:hypothetical protein
MTETTLEQLISLLGHPELRIRTGVVELPLNQLGKENDLAVRFGAGYCDICAWKYSHVPPNRTHLGLSWEGMVDDLMMILADLSILGYCVWISGVDVLLARLPYTDRASFWQFIRSTFRPPRGLLLSLPAPATHLFSNEERNLWNGFGRFAQLSALPITRIIQE